MKHFICVVPQLLLGMLLFLASCSDSDYVNAIPGGSTALISIDPAGLSGKTNPALLKTLLPVNNPTDCGVSLTNKLFLFESPEGNLGLCAKVNDDDKLERTFTTLAKQKICTPVKTRRGIRFTTLKSAWVAGFSDQALLVMGPVTTSTQAELQNAMAKYLKQGDDDGIRASAMFDKLDSLATHPMAMVIQARALPEKFIAPLTLGAPKNADASQVLIAATANIDGECIDIVGETFSFDKKVNEALRNALKDYRPIQQKYVKTMSADATIGLFANIDGKKFINQLHDNAGLQVLLAGINTAIDMDNIIRSINGNLALSMTFSDDNKQNLSIAAELSDATWLNDVTYWMQSCPKGSRIVAWGKNTYCYTDGKTSFYFGVSPDKQFFSGDSRERASAAIQPAAKPISAALQQKIIGSKMALIINWNAARDDQSEALKTMLAPLLGPVNSMIYRIK